MEWSRLLSTKRERAGGNFAKAGDLRSEFEKDYHRIIGSASFRRLQDKTQVFHLDKSDFVRNEADSFSGSIFAWEITGADDRRKYTGASEKLRIYASDERGYFSYT